MYINFANLHLHFDFHFHFVILILNLIFIIIIMINIRIIIIYNIYYISIYSTESTLVAHRNIIYWHLHTAYIMRRINLSYVQS